MRRKDREVTDREEILDIMRRCDVCRLGLHDEEYPYVVPLNFGLMADDEKVELIFHSALEGHKVDLIGADDRAGFEMDCSHQLQYFEDRGYCTYSYESVMGCGRISILDESEKMAALRAIMDQYHPGENAHFDPAAMPRTLVYKLTVEKMTGKRKELKK